VRRLAIHHRTLTHISKNENERLKGHLPRKVPFLDLLSERTSIVGHLINRTKSGFYPLETDHAYNLATLFKPVENSGRILDPVAGEGEALQILADALRLEAYANELDIERAKVCDKRFGLTHSACGDQSQLRTPNQAYSFLYHNPPYMSNLGDGVAEKRRELEMFKHAWKWLQAGGWAAWVVYNFHVSEDAAAFFAKEASEAHIFRFPQMHLERMQVVVVARKANTAFKEALIAQRLKEQGLYEKAQQPDALEVLHKQDSPRFELPKPKQIERFYFRQKSVSTDKIAALLGEQGAHLGNRELAAVMLSAPPKPAVQPVMAPRPGHTGQLIAAGFFDGLKLIHQEQEVCVRGTVRRVTTRRTGVIEDGKETITERTVPTMQITLLTPTGDITELGADSGDEMIAFIKAHRTALLDHFNANLKPIYSGDYRQFNDVFAQAFRNKKPLKNRKITGPLPAQKHIIAAAIETLLLKGSCLINGEMSTGKTLQSSVVTAALWQRGHLKPGEVTVVLSPGVNVPKWGREMRDAFPGCKVHVIDGKVLGPDNKTVNDYVLQLTQVMAEAAADPDAHHVVVMKETTAKLGEGWQASYITRKLVTTTGDGGLHDKAEVVGHDVLCCPQCGTPISSSSKDPNKWVSRSWLIDKPRTCTAMIAGLDVNGNPTENICGAALYSDVRSYSKAKDDEKYPRRNPTYPLASLLVERYSERIGLLICDEIHMMNGPSTGKNSARSMAMRRLASKARFKLGLTGTLYAGKATSIFWIEYAFNPQMWQDYPLSAGRKVAMDRWVQTMGVEEQTFTFYDSHSTTGKLTRTQRSSGISEKPGMSPLLVGYLMDHAVWIKMKDLGELPDLDERAEAIPMSPQLAAAYSSTVDKMERWMKDNAFSELAGRFMGNRTRTSLRWPSTPNTSMQANTRDEEGNPITVATFPALPDSLVQPKEERMLEIVRDELAVRRAVIIYCEQTRKRDLQPRLKNLIEQHIPDATVEILRSETVNKTEKREAWLKAKARAGLDVLICNPGLVAVGLDLVHFSHIIVYEISYDLRRLLQACHRHWRLGQDKDCRTTFLYYQGSVEAVATRLVARKKQAADMLDGELDSGGLNEEADMDDLSHELAKAIAEGAQGEGGSAFYVDAKNLFAGSATPGDEVPGHLVAIDDQQGITEPVVPLENVIGQTYQDDGGTVQVVAYGPLTDTTYKVRALYGDRVEQFIEADLVLAYLSGKQKPAPLAPLLALVKDEEPASKAVATNSSEQTPAALAAPTQPANRPPVKKTLPDKAAGKDPVPAAAALPMSRVKTSAESALWDHYLQLKEQVKPAILLFEMGEIYQAFNDDAEIIARELERVLVSQSIGNHQVPTASVPAKTVQDVIGHLVSKGIPVALAEQSGGLPLKGVVRRKVTELYEPPARSKATKPAEQATVPDVNVDELVASLRQKIEAHKKHLSRGTRGLMPAVVQADDGAWYAIDRDATLFELYGVGKPIHKKVRLITSEDDIARHIRPVKQEVALINGQVEVFNPRTKRTSKVETSPAEADTKEQPKSALAEDS